jgi:hypothetical protein
MIPRAPSLRCQKPSYETLIFNILMAVNKIYQVVYCDSKFWDARKSLKEQVEKAFRWYLIKCPLIGIKEIVSAWDAAKGLKAKFGTRAQLVIIGDARN